MQQRAPEKVAEYREKSKDLLEHKAKEKAAAQLATANKSVLFQPASGVEDKGLATSPQI